MTMGSLITSFTSDCNPDMSVINPNWYFSRYTVVLGVYLEPDKEMYRIGVFFK